MSGSQVVDRGSSNGVIGEHEWLGFQGTLPKDLSIGVDLPAIVHSGFSPRDRSVKDGLRIASNNPRPPRPLLHVSSPRNHSSGRFRPISAFW